MALAMGDDNLVYLANDGNTYFQLISQEDTAEALLSIYKSGDKANEQIYNAGSDNVPTQIEQTVKLKEKNMLNFTIRYITPLKARLYSILFKPSKVNFFTRDHIYYLFSNMYLDCHKLKEDTGWEPKKDNIKILSGIVDWYNNKIN